MNISIFIDRLKQIQQIPKLLEFKETFIELSLVSFKKAYKII